MQSDNLPRNKILVVGRRGVGKLTLVQSILGSRFVPTTSASKSRPSSPLILPAIPVPTLEETIVEEHGIPSHSSWTFSPPQSTTPTTTPPNESHNGSTTVSTTPTTPPPPLPSFQFTQEESQQGGDSLQEDTLSESQSQKRTTQDHSGVTIPWTIDTKYYSVQVDFWIDETDVQGETELERMIGSGELDEMGSVIEAFIFCFSKNQPSTFHDIKPWLAFVERHEPSITLCVATDAPSTLSSETEQRALANQKEEEETVDDYDDWCLGNGFEYVNLQERPSDMSQDEHVGLDRIMEALAAHMWDGLKRKSSKKREEHERSMMLSFQDDDVDMTYDLSWRKSLLGLDNHNQSRVHEEMQGQAEDNDDNDDDDDEEDEDDDRVFYRALAELNLQNRPTSPSALSHGPVPLSQARSTSMTGNTNTSRILGYSSQDTGTRDGLQASGFGDDFELSDQDLKALESEDPEFWSSQGDSRPLDRALEKRFREFLGQSVDDSITSSSETGGKESSLGDMDDIDLSDKDISFELNEDGEFEFGSYVVASAEPGGEELHDLDIGDEGEELSTPNQESIRSMHRALFSNIDDDDGLSHTISTLQGLREQGKTMSEHDRRELAARVALSFGMHLGDD